MNQRPAGQSAVAHNWGANKVPFRGSHFKRVGCRDSNISLFTTLTVNTWSHTNTIHPAPNSRTGIVMVYESNKWNSTVLKWAKIFLWKVNVNLKWFGKGSEFIWGWLYQDMDICNSYCGQDRSYSGLESIQSIERSAWTWYERKICKAFSFGIRINR